MSVVQGCSFEGLGFWDKFRSLGFRVSFECSVGLKPSPARAHENAP